MKRHAYLIIAHDKRYQLEQLLSLLDHPRNDIYLLVDSRGSLSTENLILTNSNLFILPPIQINWAGFSMILAEMMLLRVACEREYHYYHLLSGSDLPLVSQKKIHDFLEDSDVEYVNFAPENKLFAHFEVAFYHFFVDLKLYRKYLVIRIIGHALVRLQSVIGIDRTRNLKMELFHGSTWFSITHKLAKHLIFQEVLIKKAFRYALCADEVFIQTLLMNSLLKGKLYDCSSGKTQNLRYIDWRRRNKNSPYTFRISDIEELKQAGEHAFFARKFDEKIDRDVINEIVSRLKGSDGL